MMDNDEKYMKRCIELAMLGRGRVSPNPMVGSVIVHCDKIIAEGYHQNYGQAHAELNAIQNLIENCKSDMKMVEQLLSESTIYVSLEPCAHFGQTPPCVDLILKYKIPKVIVGSRDPFPLVDGEGIEKLQNEGIQVTVGVLEEECVDLNRRFFTYVQEQRPYIILKWAQTKDEYFAPPTDEKRKFWITCEMSDKLDHQWRSEEDAILVGKNTVLIDNPQLNVRYASGKSPKRFVLDRRLEIPQHLNVFNQSVETFILNEKQIDKAEGKTKFISNEKLTPSSIASIAYKEKIQSIIIEGGAQVLESFIQENLWDEARIFTGNVYLKSGIKSPRINGEIIKTDLIGDDCLCILRNNLPKNKFQK